MSRRTNAERGRYTPDRGAGQTSKDDATTAVLKFSFMRFSASGEPGSIGYEIRKAVRARGLSVSLADYLDTLARSYDIRAKAMRLAARAARGENLDVLVSEPIV